MYSHVSKILKFRSLKPRSKFLRLKYGYLLLFQQVHQSPLLSPCSYNYSGITQTSRMFQNKPLLKYRPSRFLFVNPQKDLHILENQGGMFP